jgi:hypothetical protein
LNAMIECDGEVVVDDGALRRLVFDFEMATGERQPVERLGGAGHAFGRDADEGGKSGGVSVRGRRPGQRDRGRARIAGDRKRERAVAGDAQAKVEPVEFKPAHPDVHQRQGEGIEAHASARRGKDGVAGGVAHGEALEAQAHAPRIMHEIGRSERDGVTVADALLEGVLDLVVHADQTKRPARQQRGQHEPADDEQSCDELDGAEANVG